MELYSYSKHKGFCLFVECVVDEDEPGTYYEGAAQKNGTTLFHNRRMLTDDNAEADLIRQIDDNETEEW